MFNHTAAARPGIIFDLEFLLLDIGRGERACEPETRLRLPMRAGAESLLPTLAGQGMDLHYVSTLGPQASVMLVRRHRLIGALTTIYTPPQAVRPCARPALVASFVQSTKRPPQAYLLLSDWPPELYAAQVLGMTALGLGYGRVPPEQLESIPGLLGVASSPSEVSRWLLAGWGANQSRKLTSRRDAARLH
ncbi:MAG: hypothetical protein ACT4QA_11350 [Panacagrimonas sp.]